MVTTTQILIVAAILSNAIVFGTDAFSAIVVRPALAYVSEDVLVRTMGHIHLYGDKRLSLPGTIGSLLALGAAVTAGISGNGAAAVAAAVAVVVLLVWLAVFMRSVAPINKALTTAAMGGAPISDARARQAVSDGVLPILVACQGAALVALSVAGALS
ncbi:DUF1772 domain-containing protein [Nocardia sp. BSTN01]|nr:DUF1772 domain-containing protein [Nocardia sp. BSTN01]